MALFIFYNINKPRRRLHVTIILNMSGIHIDFSEFKFSFARSSGPGGQSVNTASSKATLHWDIDSSPSLSEDIKARFKEKYSHLINKEGLVFISSETHRSQKQNMDECAKKLHGLIQTVELAPKVRKPTRPKKSAVRKRLNTKKLHSLKKRNRNYKE